MATSVAQKQSPRPRRARRFVKRAFGVAALLVLVVGAYVGYRIYDTMSTVHSVSTPPPHIDADAIGGTPGTVIDSGPALTAIATYSVKDSNEVQPTAQTQSHTGIDLSAPFTRPLMRQDGTAGAETDTVTTYLLMGVDARPGESIDIGIRPDSLSVAAYDTATNTCRLLAIPRDSRVELPGYGLSKINHALAVGGIPYEKLVVEQFLGFSIDHYALIDFSGVTTVIDEIGGIDLVVTDDTFDILDYTFYPGPVHLNGDEALAYARFRGGPDGDYGRTRRQQQVIEAALSKLASSSAPSMTTLVPTTMDAIKDHVRTDIGIGELTTLATDVIAHCANGGGMTNVILGEDADMVDDLSGDVLSFLIPDEADRDRKVQWLLTGSDPSGFFPGSDTSRWADVAGDALAGDFANAQKARAWTPLPAWVS